MRGHEYEGASGGKRDRGWWSWRASTPPADSDHLCAEHHRHHNRLAICLPRRVDRPAAQPCSAGWWPVVAAHHVTVRPPGRMVADRRRLRRHHERWPGGRAAIRQCALAGAVLRCWHECRNHRYAWEPYGVGSSIAAMPLSRSILPLA